MSTALPVALVSHELNGRLRLRVPSHRGRHDYFTGVQEKLAQCDGVDSVNVNPVTGSVLVHHQTSAEAVGDYSEKSQLFRLTLPDEEAFHPFGRELASMIASLKSTVAHLRRGEVDAGGLLFIALLLAGVAQASRGNVWPAALTLFTYAVKLPPSKR